jgi:hypothetical protein
MGEVHAVCIIETRNAYKRLVGKSKRKISLGRHRHKCGSMVFLPSFMKIDTGIRSLLGGRGDTDSHTGRAT